MKRKLRSFISAVLITAFCFVATPLMATDLPYGTNLLTNPSCDNNDYEGWTITNGGSGWAISNGGWASSYSLCTMTQTVDLLTAGFTAEQLDASPVLLAAGSFNCPWSGSSHVGVATLKVYLLDASDNTLQTVTIKDTTYQAADIAWNTYSKEVQIPVNTRKLKYYFAGNDSRYWTGQYGPNFDNTWVSLATTASTSHSVSCATVDNGTIFVTKTTASAGDTVKVSGTPNTDYSLKNWNVKTSSGSIINPLSDSTFIMPAGFDVIVSGEFWKISGIVVSCATVSNGAFTVDKTTASYSDTVTISVVPDAGYGLKNYTVTNANNESITVGADSTFTVPAGYDITVSGEFWKTEGLAVSCATVSNGAFTVDKTTANYGDSVTISVVPAAGYGLKNFTVTNTNNENITVAADSTFTVPAEYDITVSGEFWKTEGLAVSCATVSNGAFTVDKTTANYGDIVTISVVPAADYTLKNYTVTNANNESVTVGADSTFTVPAGYDITVSGEFWKTYEITAANPFIEGFENGNLDTWSQQSEMGNNNWNINSSETTYNRSPYADTYNATLRYGNTDWLFTPLYLTENTTYDFEMYARQDYQPTTYANITVMLGQWASNTAMTSIVATETGLTWGDYQKITGSITMPTSGIYILGIKGFMNGSPYYISIDDIKMSIHDEATSVNQFTAENNIKIYSKAGSIIVENTTSAQEVQVYDIKGCCIANTTNRTIAVPTTGLYLVRIGTEIRKVMVE